MGLVWQKGHYEIWDEFNIAKDVTYTENYTDPYLQEIPFYTPLYTGSNDFIGEKKQPTILIPIYVIIICVVGALILTIFIVYMVYRCATRNRHFKYYLPRENRLTTFHNPRTIMTAENLRSQANTIQSNHETRTQLYTTYDAYRQPCVAYVPAAEPIAIAITHQGEDLASNSPPPSYEPVDSHSQGYNIHESYYGNTDEQPSLRTPYREDDVTRLPECSEISSHISDDQIQASKISLSSESSSSTEASMPSKTDQTTGTLKSLSEDLQEDYEKCYEKALNDDSYTPDHHYSAKQKQTSCDNPYDIEEAQSVGDEMYI
ncbi:hypothetical protein SK128_015784 [Halocaridina rubra]|uniref:Uncharacterized protein n=1 Tax=Halocaridina rubra TaxID=373956 RepID=A0AAN8WPK9_HALRR